MSFLSSLRQQNETEKPFSLCYLLSIDDRTQRASLSLILAGLQDGRLTEPGRAYTIHRQHLQQPPPFIDDSDQRLLQALLGSASAWLESSSGDLPDHNTLWFMQQLLGSQRCFIGNQNQGWQLLQQGPNVEVGASWLIDSDGSQLPRWHCEQSNSMIFLCPDDSSLPFVLQVDNSLISLGVSPLGHQALRQFHRQISLPAHDVDLFLERRGSDWRAVGLPLPRSLPIRRFQPQLGPRLRCLKAGDGMPERLQLCFRYHTPEFCCQIEADAEFDRISFWSGEVLLEIERHLPDEEACLQALTPLLQGFTPLPGGRQWRAEEAQSWRQLLLETRDALAEIGCDIQVQPGFRYHYVQPERWQVELGRQGRDWELAMHLQVDGERLDLLQLLRQLRQQRCGQLNPVLVLADGRLLLMDADTLGSLSEELRDLLEPGRHRLPGSQLNRLHSLQQLLPRNTDWRGELALLEQVNSLHNNPAVINSRPQALNAELRPYQWLGVCWLQHLKQHRVNGLLADDMGLGKTLQTLAHLCLEQQSGQLRQPALIIVPTSLLYNWASEAGRFVPQLKTLVIHGPQRHRHWEDLGNYQLLITSYALLVNDLDYWCDQPLSWLILDEAQQIKNPRTQVRRALVQLSCPQRLCLSGTPVENHLGELWSILDFLMPGCLGSEREFKRQYRQPIERHGDSRRMQQLLERIAPFILRRNKDQVAADLPAKTVIEQTINLGDGQRDFYQRLKQQSWQELQTSLEQTDSGAQQQVMLLNGLLKLRQACCDPALLDQPEIASAKREHCIAMIEELVAEKRAILVFSQFTRMLDLLAEDLEKLGIDYLMLTGQSRQRQTLVDSFQQGCAPVFLISLKAGGVGLNLTRADTVIHYDPWWNQAAEQQATDRAHRIGQNKPVFAYKLIVKNSIEEKIARLQQRKALLGQHISHRGQLSAEQFSLKLDELLALWEEE
jgi:superfamily II DNA or RNA helicase